ncbi:MAG: hypothetical protein CL484_03260 [Acidobacteria bacterium]|nr:hypothetical protein [Acidobacteriota bacterium]
MWPFTRPERKKDKLAALDKVMAEQQSASRRLTENLRRAHADNLNGLLASALPKHEVPKQ